MPRNHYQPDPTTHERDLALGIECPTCAATRGADCLITQGGTRVDGVHVSRISAATTATAMATKTGTGADVRLDSVARDAVAGVKLIDCAAYTSDLPDPTTFAARYKIDVYAQGEGRMAIELSEDAAISLAATIEELVAQGGPQPAHLRALAAMVRRHTDPARRSFRAAARAHGFSASDAELDAVYDLARAAE